MKEIWKDVKGYEGLYQVSDLGRVKSLERKVRGGRGVLKIRERIMKFDKDKVGYCRLMLSKDGKRTRFLVHRLIAMTFIGNPENLPQINHKDENKENNNVDNLEWCTAQYNNTYNGRALKANAWRRKQVNQYNEKGQLVGEWDSLTEAANNNNISPSCICMCCNNMQEKTRNGHTWEYVQEAI